MIQVDTAVNYFENIAVKNKDILHTEDKPAFFHGDIEELLEDIAGCNSDGYVLLFEHGSGILYGTSEVAANDKGDFAFTICKIVESKEQQLEVETGCKSIAADVLGKMKKDAAADVPFVRDFDLLSVRYTKVFGFGNNHFGYRFEFNMLDTSAIKYDASKWNS